MNESLRDNTQAVTEYLQAIAAAGFFGTITLKYEAGQIVHIRREESLKPEELSGKPRWKHVGPG